MRLATFARPFIPVAIAAATSGCVFRTQQIDTGSDAGPRCESMTVAPADALAALEAARARFEASGTTLDARIWEDPDAFVAFVKVAYEELGCSAGDASQAGVAQQPLHADHGPDFYCGKGHGVASLFHPPVSDCVNHACYVHDSCYTQCSASTHGCEFHAETQPCDAPFFATVDECMGTESWRVTDAVVSFIANVIASDETCGVAMTCPLPGTAAPGPCGLDRGGDRCGQCTDRVDPMGRCLSRACAEAPSDDTCYTANCSDVAPCFGGWGPGAPEAYVPDAGLPPDGGDPIPVTGDSLWDLVIEGAKLPDAKANGLPWDEDFGTGFGPPDPYASITVGTGSPVVTPTEQDNLYPTWSVRIPGLSAADLESSIAFSVTDADLVDDDAVGGCATALSQADFSGQHLSADCGALGGTAALVIYYHVEPSQ